MDTPGYDLFATGDDASALDRTVMETARRMSAAGWTDEAEQMAGCMAYLRELVGNRNDQTGGTLTGLYDVLLDVSSNAATLAELISRAHPDEIALRRGEG
jgi:hypothetical protein